MPGLAFKPALPLAWRLPLALLAAGWLVLGLIAGADWAAMAHQWWNSSTYTHVLLVPPILVWLVAQRAAPLARLTPVAWWPGLVALASALGFWLLGRLAGLAEASEAGAVAMLVALVPLLLGPRVTVGLAFPLAYMAFLVPVGDELIPALQTVTAKLTILFIHWSHVRASIDGVFIATPAGLFEIAEACSGVKFLIAMIAFGVLAANVVFLGWGRRIAFVSACVVVPVIANGIRAWGTVYVAQYKGAAYAGGFDHIVYGWIFFAIVIAAVIAVGWRFFDRPPGAPMIDAGRLLASPALALAEHYRASPPAMLALALALATGFAAWADAGAGLEAPMPAHIALPQVSGWHRVDYAPRHPWSPRAKGADHRLLGRYADASGRQVDVFIALYAAQGPGRKADGFGEGAIGEHTGWAWQAPGPAMRDALSQRLLTAGPVARLAETSWHTDALVTGRSLQLRLAGLRDRLLLRRAPTMLLILSSEERPGAPTGGDASATAEAAATIAAFRQAIGPPGPWLDRIAAGG